MLRRTLKNLVKTSLYNGAEMLHGAALLHMEETFPVSEFTIGWKKKKKHLKLKKCIAREFSDALYSKVKTWRY